MSRIEAALRRATTGAVVPQPPVADEPPECTPGSEPDFTLTRRDGLPETYSRPEAIETPVDNPAEPRFHTFNAQHAEKLVVSSTMPQQLREQYRRLAATLHHAQGESGLKTLMITSAVPNEGKTLTATNIALTLSESYQRRVLLIDADLRRPSLDSIFQLPKMFGLNEALTSMPERKVSVIQVSSRLSLLPAGAPDPDPMSTLTSDRMRRLLADAAATFEWVIIDTPPVGILTDAKLLAAMVDAAILVVAAGRTQAPLVQRAVDALGRNRLIGVVLNRTQPKPGARVDYYNSYYYSGAR